MYTFKVTMDRHAGRYGLRTSNFPKEYSAHEADINYAGDPDFVVKV